MANVAFHHARELSNSFLVTLISESFEQGGAPNVTHAVASTPAFRWLRRFGHVPRELAFAYAARHAVSRRHTQAPIDVLICHGHVAACLVGQPFAAEHEAPHILVTHGDIFERPAGTYDARLTWFYKKVTPRAYRSANLVITLSPPMRDLAIRGGADADRVIVIPNGIDPTDIGLDGLADSTSNARWPRPVILYVGRLSQEKGIDTLLKACALLRQRGQDFQLDVYGDGPLRNSSQARAAQSNLNGCVFFHGPAPRKLLGGIYRQGDIVCVPSRSDPLPAVVLEAMICGVPPVGCASGGIPFLVGDMADELLVASDDAGALAERLATFLSNPERRAAVAIRLQARAREVFSWKATGERLSQTVAALVDAGSSVQTFQRANAP